MRVQEKPKAVRPKTFSDQCCTNPSCETGLRNNYFEHKRLSVESLRVEQKYSLERRQLLNRAIYGWGVVYGFAITAAPSDHSGNKTKSGKLKIGPGLALDPCGRELLEVEDRLLSFDDVIVTEDGRRVDPAEAFSEEQSESYLKAKGERCWLLCAHYAEQSTSPVQVTGPCDCQHREWDYTCETVRYSLQRIDCKLCCAEDPCELECRCGSGPCCRERTREELRKPRDVRSARGGCKCICEYVTDLEFSTECDCLSEIEDACCRKIRIDLHKCVPLACVEVVRDECGDLVFGENLEMCGPRRLVKRNDLLFDLIRGCDLTRIIHISWKDWHRSPEAVPFNDFSDKFGPDGQDKDEYVTEFSVKFSRPVHNDTLRADCFAMTVMSAEREGGWRETLRVPIVRIDSTSFSPEPGDPSNHVRGGTLVVEGAWLEDAIRGRKNRFLGAEAWVEIEVRGDFILDCNGQTVDANAVGLVPYPSGNGGCGGTFLSAFRVAPAGGSHQRRPMIPTNAKEPTK
ncbi:MAG: hypothetical protein ACM3JB_09500 [Acidobacteriaceae bacterium]